MSRFITIKRTQTDTHAFSINADAVISIRLQVLTVAVRFIGDHDERIFYFDKPEEADEFYQAIVNTPDRST